MFIFIKNFKVSNNNLECCSGAPQKPITYFYKPKSKIKPAPKIPPITQNFVKIHLSKTTVPLTIEYYANKTTGQWWYWK